jgi:hypothetical protein
VRVVDPCVCVLLVTRTAVSACMLAFQIGPGVVRSRKLVKLCISSNLFGYSTPYLKGLGSEMELLSPAASNILWDSVATFANTTSAFDLVYLCIHIRTGP